MRTLEIAPNHCTEGWKSLEKNDYDVTRPGGTVPCGERSQARQWGRVSGRVLSSEDIRTVHSSTILQQSVLPALRLR